ncbi:MAG TPA: glycosyltransferase [Opitutaceae bacterium]|nr:glycosyltransferase [Opitutaceae bacterium]
MPVGSKVLVVSSGPLSRNPRPWKEAVALATAGFDVTVLSVFETEVSFHQDAALLANHPVHQVWLRPGGAGPGRHGYRLSVWLARHAVQYCGWQCPAALGPARALLTRIRALPADLTIVHNDAPLWAGGRLLATGRRVAADFEDWYSEDLLPEARRARPQRLLSRLEHDLLHSAAYVSTTSQAMADALYRSYGGKRPIVVTNSFPLQPRPASPTRARLPAFFWFSQTIGPGRGLETFLTAWATTRAASRVVLLGMVNAAYRESLIGLLPPARRAQLEFHPLVAPTDLPALIAEHDIGLALEPAEPANKNLTISNKILQYLNAGLAVVASDTAGQGEVFARAPGIGELVALDDTAALARRLEALLNDPARLAAARQAARRAAEETYCWEKEAPGLIHAVEAALAAS